jgi:hypothetical protein
MIMFWKFVTTLKLSIFLAISQIFAWGGILCPLQLGNFLAILRIFAWGGIFVPSNLAIFWQYRNFRLVGYLLFPPTRQVLGDFWIFVSRVIFFALRFSNFWRFLEVFV